MSLAAWLVGGLQVLAYEANIEAAVLAQDSGTVPLPEDYTHFIPKVGAFGIYSITRSFHLSPPPGQSRHNEVFRGSACCIRCLVDRGGLLFFCGQAAETSLSDHDGTMHAHHAPSWFVVKAFSSAHSSARLPCVM